MVSMRTARDRAFAVAALAVSGVEALLLAGLVATLLLTLVLSR